MVPAWWMWFIIRDFIPNQSSPAEKDHEQSQRRRLGRRGNIYDTLGNLPDTDSQEREGVKDLLEISSCDCSQILARSAGNATPCIFLPEQRPGQVDSSPIPGRVMLIP